MNLQQRYDLESLEDRIGDQLEREIRSRPQSAA